MRLGVFLPNWIGDVVMATPALRALRKTLGTDGTMVGVMRPYVAEVLAGNSWIDQAIFYEKKKRGSAGQVVQELRDARLDAVVLLPNSFNTAWLAWRAGIPRRIGYSRDARGWMLTTKLFDPRTGRRRAALPQIDSYLNLAYALGSEWETRQLELSTTAEDESLTDAVWQRLGFEGKQVAVFNSGGAFGAAKDWPAEHFAKLAKRILLELGLHVLINCGPKERDTAREIVRQANDLRVLSLAEESQLPIGLTKACIRRSQLLVTTDSGPRFFGVAFGVPTVSLFGPTGIYATRTHSELETSLSLNLDCQPCMERTCPLGHHRCMQDLTVEQVFKKIEHRLTKKRISAA